MAKNKPQPSSNDDGADFVPAEPVKATAKATDTSATTKSADSKSTSSDGGDWDPKAPRPAAAQAALSAESSVKIALQKSGVTQAMIDARKYYQKITREVIATPAAFSAGASSGSAVTPLNTVGTAFGQKWSDGRPTGKRGILVLVKAKLAPDQVQKQLLAPESESVKGEKIYFDVLQVGQPRPQGFQTYEKPAAFGASIGLKNGPTGTYGCRVWRRPSPGYPNGQKCILSNNHVMADVNTASLGDEIVQPGGADTWGDQRTVAELVEYVQLNLSDSPFVYSSPNQVDGALAWTSSKHCAPKFHGDFPFDPTPVDFYEGMRVIKEGRTTDYTEGTVHGVDTELNIPYRTDSWGNPTPPYGFFNGQIQIRGDNGEAFSKGGDSGSLVCGLHSDGAYHPIGLLFAGNGSNYTWANPIQEVFAQLDIGHIQYDPNE